MRQGEVSRVRTGGGGPGRGEYDPRYVQSRAAAGRYVK